MVHLKFNSVLYNNNFVLLYHKKTMPKYFGCIWTSAIRGPNLDLNIRKLILVFDNSVHQPQYWNLTAGSQSCVTDY